MPIFCLGKLSIKCPAFILVNNGNKSFCIVSSLAMKSYLTSQGWHLSCKSMFYNDQLIYYINVNKLLTSNNDNFVLAIHFTPLIMCILSTKVKLPTRNWQKLGFIILINYCTNILYILISYIFSIRAVINYFIYLLIWVTNADRHNLQQTEKTQWIYIFIRSTYLDDHQKKTGRK